MVHKSGSTDFAVLSGDASYGSGNKYYFRNSFSMDTFNHFGRKASSGDNGGPFLLVKSGWSSVDPFQFLIGGQVNQQAPVGDFGASGYSPAVERSDSEMISKGTTAISRTLPTNPSWNAAQFLGELREGLPRLFGGDALKKRSLKALNAGNEYLNVEFGWKPLVSDIQGFAHTVRHAHHYMAAYERGSDRKIKRRYLYPGTRSVSSWSGDGYQIIFSGAHQQPGTASISTFSLEEDWFEGAFRYHVPMSSEQKNKLGESYDYAKKIFGLRMTPELVWNLEPWTWMADWFANTGDILRNISNLGQDGLLMQYGYMMSHSRREVTRSHTFASGFSHVFDVSSSSTAFSDIKKRLPANPFGFGSQLDSLTAKQIAIMAALGLSKGGRPWNEQK